MQYGTVTLRVEFPEGVEKRPILLTYSPAVMMAWEQYLTLAPGTYAEGEYAISDENGVITLPGVRVGQRSYAIIGKDIETQSVHCFVEADKETDAGTFTLYEKSK